LKLQQVLWLSERVSRLALAFLAPVLVFWVQVHLWVRWVLEFWMWELTLWALEFS
jgi:hypothetical protein